MVLKKLSIALTLGMFPLSAQAFVLLSGPEEATLPVTPQTPDIIFRVSTSHPPFEKKEEYRGGIYKDQDDDQFWQSMVQDVADVWNNIPGAYLNITVVSDPAAEINETDKINAISVGNQPVTVAASANPQVEDKIINDCDITIGKSKREAKELAYTMMHELGHCIGLGHNHGNYNAVMGYSRTSMSLYLSPDDKAGVVYLYRDPQYDPPKELVSCGTVGGAHAGLQGLWFAVPLVALWCRRRRR